MYTSNSTDVYINTICKYVYCFIIQKPNKIILIRKTDWMRKWLFLHPVSITPGPYSHFRLPVVQHRWPGHLTNTFNPPTVNQTFQSNSLYRRQHDLPHGHAFRNRSRYKFAMKHHAPILIARKANLSACKRCHKRGVAEKFTFNTKRTPVPSARTDETPLCVDTIRITQY